VIIHHLFFAFIFVVNRNFHSKNIFILNYKELGQSGLYTYFEIYNETSDHDEVQVKATEFINGELDDEEIYKG